MELQQGNQLRILGADRGLQAATILFHIFAGIPLRKSEVQDGLAGELADAAGTSAESMDYPWQLSQRRDLQNTQAANCALSESSASRLFCVPPLSLDFFSPGTLGRGHKSVSIIAVRGDLPPVQGEI